MKKEILRESGTSLLLFLWLMLVQFAGAFFFVITLLVLALCGVIPVLGPTPFWAWMASGVLVCLFWLMMGWLAPRAARPGPVGAGITLAVGAALTVFISNTPLLFFPQELCGGMLERILDHSSWIITKLVPCFLLPAVLGIGLLLGRKRTA